MPNIAQQDYIVIDWGGKDCSYSDKKAEVDAQLKNIYLANPLSLLSVLFKHYGDGVTENTYYPMLAAESEGEDSSSATIVFYDTFNAVIVAYNFSIE